MRACRRGRGGRERREGREGRSNVCELPGRVIGFGSYPERKRHRQLCKIHKKIFTSNLLQRLHRVEKTQIELQRRNASLMYRSHLLRLFGSALAWTQSPVAASWNRGVEQKQSLEEPGIPLSTETAWQILQASPFMRKRWPYLSSFCPPALHAVTMAHLWVGGSF